MCLQAFYHGSHFVNDWRWTPFPSDDTGWIFSAGKLELEAKKMTRELEKAGDPALSGQA